jgi:glyoxylase-like metal-dependent hydrolase (beta-lactamase superfamily II)
LRNEETKLSVEVFTAPTRPVLRPPDPPAPPGGWTWPPTAATLIAGERDAVLVDTLVTIDDVFALADWVEAKGKRVTTIYVTHEHGDHYLGAPVLLARFPGSRLVSTQTVVELIRLQFATPIVEQYWRPMFGGGVAEGQVLPEVLEDNVIDLEGHKIAAFDVGQSDCEHSTFLHVKEASAVVIGDIAYNGVHMHLGATDHAKRLEWVETIRGVAVLQPEVVVAAHQVPDGSAGSR